jgi:hypothetical protein
MRQADAQDIRVSSASPPPAFGSAIPAALQRVRNFGHTHRRTVCDSQFRNDPLQVGNHGAHWNQIAVGLIVSNHLNEARPYVLESLNLALSDASMRAWMRTPTGISAVPSRSTDHAHRQPAPFGQPLVSGRSGSGSTFP